MASLWGCQATDPSNPPSNCRRTHQCTLTMEGRRVQWNAFAAVFAGLGGLLLSERLRRKKIWIPSELRSSIWASRMLVATALASEAGQAMLDAKALCAREGPGKKGDGVSYKGRHDLVTETDRSNEALIQQGLHEAFPEDQFLGEEASADRGGVPLELSEKGLTWVVDPIDGTTNFVHGFPVTCVSIGLAKGNEIVAGVVYNPFTKELYQAIEDKGSFLNGNRLKVSGTTVLGQAMVMTEYSSLREEESLRKMLDTTGAIVGAARAVRQTGCGAMDLCFLAKGSVDAVFGGVAGVWKPWDWAAGVLIAKEAGAAISAGDRGEFKLMGDTVLGAATDELASSLSALTRNIGVST